MNNDELRRLLAHLRSGALTDDETADFVAVAGTQHFVEAKNDVLALLDHADGIVRFNALATLAYEWGDTDVLPRALVMLRTDPDRDCRCQAAGAIGSVSRARTSPHVIEVLASVVRDSSEHSDVRAFAFTAFLDVAGVPRSEQPNPVDLVIGSEQLKWLDAVLNAHLRTD